MLKWLTPDAYFDSVYDIELEGLMKQGIKGLIIDLDNTLIPRDRNHTSEKLLKWLDDIEQKGLKICVVSNNTHARGKEIATKIGRPVIGMARKPSRAAFKKALDILKTPKDQTVVIGDQIFTDVFGGSRMGLKTILVVPLKGKDFWLTAHLVRRIERFVLKRLVERNLIPSPLTRLSGSWTGEGQGGGEGESKNHPPLNPLPSRPCQGESREGKSIK